MGRATFVDTGLEYPEINFNPRPPWGGRPQRAESNRASGGYFNPRPPWGGRQEADRLTESIKNEFQSTPSVGRATETCIRLQIFLAISIHALRGEGDAKEKFQPDIFLYISIHALRGEGDLYAVLFAVKDSISIHALRGEGDGYKADFSGGVVISIHALRGEGDHYWRC